MNHPDTEPSDDTGPSDTESPDPEHTDESPKEPIRTQRSGVEHKPYSGRDVERARRAADDLEGSQTDT